MKSEGSGAQGEGQEVPGHDHRKQGSQQRLPQAMTIADKPRQTTIIHVEGKRRGATRQPARIMRNEIAIKTITTKGKRRRL
jgi:hypothetical protein